MKKQVAIAVLGILSGLANAVEPPQTLVMDKVIFQVSAKQWVTTQSVLLTVNINATLTNADLVNARAEIINNLNKIAKGEWQLTQFDRSQDSSGLEKLYVMAQARVLQAGLSDIYKNAKGISKPGASYEINRIEFKPSLEEVQQVKAQLRERLYEQLSAELGRLNRIYTNQNYSLNRVFFYEGEQAQPLARADQTGEIKPMAMAVNARGAPAPALALTVSNELILSAMVELASNRPRR